MRSRPLKRPIDIRDRRPVMSVPDRARRLPPPEKYYDRRPPGAQMVTVLLVVLSTAAASSFLILPSVHSSCLPKEKSKERIWKA
jgi:hypothetical protein